MRRVRSGDGGVAITSFASLVQDYVQAKSWGADIPLGRMIALVGDAELDEAKRGAIYIEMQTIVRDEGGSVIPCFANNVDAASDKLGRPEKIGGNFELDGARSMARWWFI